MACTAEVKLATRLSAGAISPLRCCDSVSRCSRSVSRRVVSICCSCASIVGTSWSKYCVLRVLAYSTLDWYSMEAWYACSRSSSDDSDDMASVICLSLLLNRKPIDLSSLAALARPDPPFSFSSFSCRSLSSATLCDSTSFRTPILFCSSLSWDCRSWLIMLDAWSVTMAAFDVSSL